MAISSKTSNMLTDSGASKNNNDWTTKAAQATANAFNKLLNYNNASSSAHEQGSGSGVSGVLAARDEIINNLKGSGGGGSTTKASTAKASSGSSYSGGGDYSSSAISSGPSILDLLRQNYLNALNEVNSRYDLQDQNINSQNEDALRQQYIAYMMSKKNADNDMARQGYTGGLAESNKARMLNNYMNGRVDLLKQKAQQLEEQRAKRNAELIQLLSNFNNQQARYLY